jgi:hypothetical protein
LHMRLTALSTTALIIGLLGTGCPESVSRCPELCSRRWAEVSQQRIMKAALETPHIGAAKARRFAPCMPLLQTQLSVLPQTISERGFYTASWSPVSTQASELTDACYETNIWVKRRKYCFGLLQRRLRIFTCCKV